MKIGFAKVDITPRVGVELCGFGAYLNRHSIAVRDRLWARAMAIQHGETTLLLISCDLIGVTSEMTRRARAHIAREIGLPPTAIMLQATHTHSGPATMPLIGWGDPDQPYLELLPARIARAGVEAVAALTTATLRHAAVPCEGIGLNREYDRDAPPLAEVLDEAWRPAKPELTDTVCHVLAAETGGRLLGFLSYFGCHPVVCCETTRYIHGDFVGVATNLLEREHPGAVGLFLQGAQGDVNSCVVHKPEAEAMLALDIIAARYARSVRAGLLAATPLAVDRLDAARLPTTFSRIPLTAAEVRARLADEEAILTARDATDTDQQVRLAVVRATTYRRVLRQLDAGDFIPEPTELHAFRIGPLALLGTPFEVFQAIKTDIVAAAHAPLPLLLGLTNDSAGYAPDHTSASLGGYAAQLVPLMLGTLPYQRIHDELVSRALELEGMLTGNEHDGCSGQNSVHQ